jgi:transcriptional regulator with XRE-family HTH domain
MYDEGLLAKRIADERNARDWTQQRLADELTKRGVPSRWSAISKIEIGSRPVHARELSALADIFDMSIDVLVGQPPTGGDMEWLRRSLTRAAVSVARTTAESADLFESISGTARHADPDDTQGLAESAESLNAALRAAVLAARAMIRKGETGQ